MKRFAPGAIAITSALIWLTGTGFSTPTLGQSATPTATPSTSQMIEQLKPSRTRSLRNLTVEAAPEKTGDGAAVAPAARPSLSMLIEFDFDSARLRPESHRVLSDLSDALRSPDLVDSRFAVEGHTDAKGNASYNQTLSEARALAVRDFLTQKGVEPRRIQASGKGASDLANSAAPFAPENRRVRIVNLD